MAAAGAVPLVARSVVRPIEEIISLHRPRRPHPRWAPAGPFPMLSVTKGTGQELEVACHDPTAD
eukprot:3935934-Rhodomonas_salina.1